MNIVKVLCSAVVLWLVFPVPIHAAEHFPFLGEVSKGPVNVRAGANTNFEVVDKLNKGMQVVVLGRSFEWYKIQIPGTATAYVKQDFVMAHGVTGEITGTRINVRVKPNATASVIGQVTKGDTVQLLGKVDTWWRIDPPANGVAWIHSDFVQRKTDASASGPQVPVPQVLPQAPVSIIPEPPVPAIVPVTVEGQLRRLTSSGMAEAHYQILVKDKPAFYLRDLKGLERFNGSVVRLEGTISPESNLPVPLMLVSKVTLVL